jgi:hypothetical protein
MIERTHAVMLPSGSRARVNVFDFNLSSLCDAYVQLEDGAWIKARALKVLRRAK